jgi:cation transport regulator ChaB
MRYKSVHDLPEVLRELLPNKEAQRVYLDMYNETWDTYIRDAEGSKQSRDAEAHRDGWAAVQREFVYDREKGIWYRKGEKLQEDTAEGFIDKIKSLVM